jgi:formate hydrogenlyase subunit 3/multisubunit Na+/H+ antiporter MnhD subunit
VNTLLLLLVWSMPLVLALFAGWRHARWVALVAPLPALVAAATLPLDTRVALPWLLLGTELGLDSTGRVFLLFSGLLWLAAGLYAAGSAANERHTARWRIFFLLAMSGNLGLIVAQDMVSFYLGFTLMGLAVYGLVVHPATLRARRAARRYLAWTIAGELLLFVAIVMLVAQNAGALSFDGLASNPPAGLVVLLLVIGFGIKLALPGLHLWLPQTYAVTPTPGVAVLSGAMIKAGLLGWLRFLPPGDAALADWGQALMVAGVAGIFFGAGIGLLQQHPRLLLGYSSISKMGVLTAGMGATLAWPAAAPVLIGALALYAAHHALVKGALFLGLGLAERGGLRPWLVVGLGFLALALAGAPFTSGALAKSALTTGLPEQAQQLVTLLAASALATTLLMARFLFLVWRQRRSAPAPCGGASTTAWLALLAVISVFPFALADDAAQLFVNLGPVSLGVVLATAALLAAQRFPGRLAMDKRFAAARRTALRFARSVRHLPAAPRFTALRLVTVWRDLRERVRQTPGRRSLQPRSAPAGEDRWPLAGAVWLGISALLIIAFVSTA